MSDGQCVDNSYYMVPLRRQPDAGLELISSVDYAVVITSLYVLCLQLNDLGIQRLMSRQVAVKFKVDRV